MSINIFEEPILHALPHLARVAPGVTLDLVLPNRVMTESIVTLSLPGHCLGVGADWRGHEVARCGIYCVGDDWSL